MAGQQTPYQRYSNGGKSAVVGEFVKHPLDTMQSIREGKKQEKQKREAMLKLAFAMVEVGGQMTLNNFERQNPRPPLQRKITRDGYDYSHSTPPAGSGNGNQPYQAGYGYGNQPYQAGSGNQPNALGSGRGAPTPGGSQPLSRPGTSYDSVTSSGAAAMAANYRPTSHGHGRR